MITRTQTGFTLYELLTTMLIVGVVLALGVPNMRDFRQNSRMTSAVNDLHSSFHHARSEAGRAKSNITICSSANSMDPNPTCGGEYENGWIVFEDTDGDIVVDAGENIIRRFPAVVDGIVINSGGGGDYFSFAASGQGRGNVTGTAPADTLRFCDERGNEIAAGGNSAARVLIVTPLGRATVLRKKDQVAAQGGC